MQNVRTPTIVGWLMVTWLAACSSFVQGDENPASVEEKRSIRQFVQSAHKSFGFCGAVLVAKDGKVVVSTGVGMSGPNASTPIDSATLFEIASCTKSFTAIAILQLQEAGKLRLDDSISKHLPGVPENCQAITVRHLLQHTSGIPGTNTTGRGDRFSDVLPTFLAGGPRHEPGTHWEYWNQGYSLLSEVVANASGMSYQDCCRQKIFKPAGMTSTCFTGDILPPNATVTIGASMKGASRSALDHPYGSYGYQYRGMGGIVSNLNDLWLFIEALTGGKLLNEESRQAMANGATFGYGLGWRVADSKVDKQMLSHSGSVRGFLASMSLCPEDGSCSIVLAGSDHSLPFSIVEAAATESMFRRLPDVKFPSPLSEDEIQATVGRYQDARGRIFTISREGGIVAATINWGGPVTRGYLGVFEPKETSLFMIRSYKPLQLSIDGTVILKGDRQKTTTVTLADLTPPLSFERLAD